MRQNTKTIFGGATTATTLSAEYDTVGFSFAKIVHLGSGTALANAASGGIVIVESDTSGGTTNTITGYVQGTDFTASTAVSGHSTSLAKAIVNLDLRGRKRYIKATFVTGTTTALNSTFCELSSPSDGVDSVTAGGAVNGVGF